MKRRGLSLIALVFLSLMFVAACGAQEPAAQVAPVIVEKEVIKEVMVPGETIVVTKEVVVEVPVEKIVTVEKEVVKEVMVPGETVTVTKEVVKEVMVPGETIVVTKEVVKEVVKEVMVPGETIVVEKEVIKLVEIDRPLKVLKISSGQDIRTFTPYPSESGTMLRAFGLIFSNLVSVDPINVNIAPDLAESWEYAPDGSSITFFLRKGALFHDGAPVTAKDVAFSIELNLDPTIGRGQLTAIKGGEAYRAGETDSIPGVVIIDDHTIRIDFEQPTGTFLNSLVDLRSTFPILPEHILAKIEPRSSVGTHEFFLKPIGTGPFKVVELVPGQGFSLEAFDDYFFGRAKIDKITFRVITSGDAAWIALLRGDIDYAVRTSFGKNWMRRFDSALNDPRFHAAGAESLSARGIFLVNTRLDHFKDPRVMQAMVHALDRNAMNKAFFGGRGLLVNSPIHVGEVQNREDLLPIRYPYDPDKAKQLLTDAGWDFDRVVPTIAYTGQMKNNPEFMASIVQYLGDVGFKMELEILDDPWARFRTWNSDTPGGGEVSLTGTPMWPNPDTWLNLMIHSSGWNGAGYASPEMDVLIEAARGVMTDRERTMLYQDIALELQEKLPSAWIAPSPGAIFLHNKRWYTPFFASQSRPASVDDIFYAPIKTNGADWWKFHAEMWDIR
jgi:peptide/nickel transport system substrate-binding protein